MPQYTFQAYLVVHIDTYMHYKHIFNVICQVMKRFDYTPLLNRLKVY